MKKLHDWLVDPAHTYADGVELLKEVKPKDSKFYESVKNPPRDSYHFRQLESTLKNELRKRRQGGNLTENQDKPNVEAKIQVVDLTRKLANAKKKPVKQTEGGENVTSPTIVSNPLVDVKELPESLQKVYFRNKAIPGEMSRLQVQLKEAKSDEERKVFANELVDLEDEKAANWKLIDDWWAKHSKEKEKSPEDQKVKDIETKLILKVQRIKTLKINISRAEKEIGEGKLSGKKLENRNSSLDAWRIELADLEK